jgi:hypothetical protein
MDEYKMKHYISTFLVCILFTGCSHSSKKSVSDSVEPLPVPVLDLGQASLPENEDNYEETVRYIPLETNGDVIIDKRRRILYCSDSRIVVVNEMKGDVFVFDGQGKIVSHFNHRGPGPEEYLNLQIHIYGTVAVYDEINREIFVMESRGRCNVYSEEGRHLRTFDFPKNKQYREAYSFDSETLLAYDANTDTDSAYVFLSKKDGRALSRIDIPLKRRLSNTNRRVMPNGRLLTTSGIPRQQLLKDGDDLILAEMSSDTLYRFTRDKRLIPILVYTPSVHDSETPVTFQPLKVTGKCVFGFKYVFDLSEKAPQPNAVSLIYDLEKRQTFQLKGSPDMDYYVSGYNVSNTDLPAGLLIQNGFPDRILEDLEKGELSGKIKEVAEKLDGDDNPVIQVIKFK